jgi:hypothetical protein
MSSKELKASSFSQDTLELLQLLYKFQVEYLIVGGYAVNYYGHLRLTGDIDIYFSNSDLNVLKLYDVLSEFWGGNIPNLENPEDLKDSNMVLQYGVPPNRVDLINTVDGIEFDEAWKTKEEVSVHLKDKVIYLHYISLDLLIRNKEKVKRPKDIDDLEFLKAAEAKRQNNGPK